MRRALCFVVVSAAFVVSRAPHVEAAPTAPAPGPAVGTAQRPNIELPATITDARRSPPPKAPRHPPYSAGQIYYDVEIRNPTSKPLVTELLVEGGIAPRLAQIAKVPVNVPPNSSAWVNYVDPDGLGKSSCAPSAHKLSLGTGAAKKLVITPSCTFTTNVVDPTAPIPPDTKQAQRANKLYHSSPALSRPAPTKCGDAIGVRASLVNSSSTNAQNAHLKLDLPAEGDTGPMSQQPDIGPGKTSGPLDVGYGFASGIPGKYTLVAVGGGAPTWQQGWSLDITRACQIDVSLAPWTSN